jgi:heme exporter protein D
MLELLRTIRHEPFLAGLVVLSVLLVIVLMISALAEYRRNRKTLARRERARRQQLDRQRAADGSAPATPERRP